MITLYLIQLMLEKIIMQGIASFGEDGCEFKNLSKVNIIYGSNGTGKTTLSGFLQHPDEDKYKGCKMEWKDGTEQEIMVYNKTFRDSNIKETDIPGVFTLGKANTEQIEAIEKKRILKGNIEEQLQTLKITLTEKSTLYNNEVSQLKEWLWKNLYKKYPMFSMVYPGFKTKDHFYSRIMDEYKKGKVDQSLKLERLQDLHYKLFEDNDLTQFSPISTLCPTDNIELIVKDPIWTRRIVGKSDIPISKLINELNISDWVLEGRQHIKEDSDICPFCQKHTLTADLKQYFNDFFDRDFSDSIDKLKEYRRMYKEKSERILNFFITQIEKDKEHKPSFMDHQVVGYVLDNLKKCIESNLKIIEKKIASPSSWSELQDLDQFILNLRILFEEANGKIKENNILFYNKEKNRLKLKEDVWAFLYSKAAEHIAAFASVVNKLDKAIKGLKEKIYKYTQDLSKLKMELVQMEDQVTSINPTITYINGLLLQYGITSFKLSLSSIKKNCYQLIRPNGEPVANSLSEGEETFISFLYFMQLAKGALDTEKLDSDRVVVIDDPVSSLDSGILYAVSSMIKELMKSVQNQKEPNRYPIKQIFLFTHNVYFHKEVSFQDRGSYSTRKDDTMNHYWILKKYDNKSTLEECNTTNPIKSSYELLWSELRENKKKLHSITIQNLMRRILENYFTVFGNFRHIDRILAKIDDPAQKEVARTLLVWSNDGSHSLTDDISIDSPTTNTDIYYETLEMIFNKLHQGGHYKMMMREEEPETFNYIQ